jgi:serine/threonine protein kinase
LPLSSNVTTALEQSDTSELIEDVENSITKIAITKLLLHSLNLSGFNFYIEYSQLQIIKKIGEGGFGMVFLGTWNEKEVAIKKFTLKEKLNIKNILNKFIREINIISNLRHPNIVLYMGVSFHENNYYMITEYIPNGNLFEFLHNKNKNIIDEKLQVKIAYEIAIAMKYLHGRNITHCDMKSSNILLDENFTVKISDFGLSRMVNILNISETKGKFGTTHWMPPEIMKAKKYEEASDVFSYGMIVWEMMTGKVPYYGLAPNQIVGLVADCRKIVEIPKEGNSALRKLVKNCLQYVPDKRPSFEEIIVYLDKVMDFMNNHDYIMDEIYQYVC